MQKQDELIEKFGFFIEQNGGFPRIAGKIFGYLLICDPPEQTAKQIITKLNIAKSSFSSMINLLLKTQLIEETIKSGERSRYYRIQDGAWENMLLKQLECLTDIRILFNEGKELLKDKDDSVKKRINEIDKLYEFLEQEMPTLITKWKNKKY